jgi:hypothetical protein
MAGRDMNPALTIPSDDRDGVGLDDEIGSQPSHFFGRLSAVFSSG